MRLGLVGLALLGGVALAACQVAEEQMVDEYPEYHDGKLDCNGPLCDPSEEACSTCHVVFESCWAWVPPGDDGALCVQEFDVCLAEAEMSGTECPSPDPSDRALCDDCRVAYLDCWVATDDDAAREACRAEHDTCVAASGLDQASCTAPNPAEAAHCLSCHEDHASCDALKYVCDDWFHQCAQAADLGRICLPPEPAE